MPSKITPESVASVPMCEIGPVLIHSQECEGEVMVPMATYETTVWPSTNRGAAVTRRAGGIQAVIVCDCMSRSILVQAPSASAAAEVSKALAERESEAAKVIAGSSRFARLQDLHCHQVGDLLYVRVSINSGDAAGHNMVTLACDHLMSWMLAEWPQLTYVSISGNFCTDKKASSVNAIAGRGKHVICETTIPAKLVSRYLKTTPQAIADLNVKKNLIGSVAAGGVQTANAHYANMLLAVYLATGQDAANLVEGSQGITYAEARGDDLYFSVTLPSIIVGTVGHGKGLPFVEANLRAMGCLEEREPGVNARRLAIIVGSTVLCGELSLMAALTNPGELMQAHTTFER